MTTSTESVSVPSGVGSASVATTNPSASKNDAVHREEEHADRYRCLVLDSGPIIKMGGGGGLHSLWRRADKFYTVPAVLRGEIRDARSRRALKELPFDLECRSPSSHAVNAVTSFAKQTGDYNSLSSADVQVLALLYDLEKEGCGGDASHVRTAPKRTVGLGKISSLSKRNGNDKGKIGDAAATTTGDDRDDQDDDDDSSSDELEVAEEDVVVEGDDGKAIASDEKITDDNGGGGGVESGVGSAAGKQPKTWAALLGGSSSIVPERQTPPAASTFPPSSSSTFAANRVTEASNDDGGDDGGQFSDADEDDFDVPVADEKLRRRRQQQQQDLADVEPQVDGDDDGDDGGSRALRKELQSDFPSLAASRLVPYEGEDNSKKNDDGEGRESASSSSRKNAEQDDKQHQDEDENDDEKRKREEQDERRKQEALKPVSKSGKLYNSFRKYGDLMKPKPQAPKNKDKDEVAASPATAASTAVVSDEKKDDDDEHRQIQSRIMGGMTLSGQGNDVDDDGEGWVTCARDIRAMKASSGGSSLDPTKTVRQQVGGSPHPPSSSSASSPSLAVRADPPAHRRTACATTDFAMQNVVLQMNLVLLSVDGMKVRKLKSWVTRCGACYRVHSSQPDGTGSAAGPLGSKRLFCEWCGSDFMQRVAASVDGRTGRLKLHLSKRYRHNLRGTKFSLPKPGSGNKYQGDLLLREDQLLTGAWRQKVKMRSGGRARGDAQSIFGRDVASNVGCHAHSATTDDIRVGFGRRNPNAARGRERRGKKKKSSDKACGLRRY